MNIGEKIKDLRVQNGLTQEELADRCELSKGFISQLENDITSPSISTLVDMLTVLGSDLRSFFNEKSNVSASNTFDRSDIVIFLLSSQCLVSCINTFPLLSAFFCLTIS